MNGDVEVITLNILDEDDILLGLDDSGPISLIVDDAPGSSGGNYNKLNNKPSINGFTVIGDKISSDYKLQDEMEEITIQDIDNMIYGGF